MSRPVVLRAVAPAEQLLEGLPELRAEDGVDDGVEGGVEVAQPEEEAEDPGLHAALAEGRGERHDEEGEPAEDEGAGDDGQGLGRLLLAFRFQGHVLLLLLPAQAERESCVNPLTHA